MNTEVVIATDLPALSGGGERALQLARWLVRRGVRVEILAIGEGTRPDLARFRDVAPTVVVDRFRRTGVAALPQLVGARTLASRMKTLRLRRWLDRRKGATLLIQHPTAANLLRVASSPPRRVVAAFPNDSWSLGRLRPEDAASLVAADAWITSSSAQTAELRRSFGGPVLELDARTTGMLLDRNDLPAASRSETARAPVVLLASPGTWEAVDHAVEVAWRLHRAVPGISLRWVADGTEDVWLTHHDIDHAGLRGVAEVRSPDDVDLLHDIAAVVRTGYEPSRSHVVLAAALAAVPVLGMHLGELPGVEPCDPFDVEHLVSAVAQVTTDTSARIAAGTAAQDAVAHLDLDQHISALTELLLPPVP